MKINHIRDISLILISAVLGAGIYDLAINLKISYNKEVSQMMCKKGRAYEQIVPGSTVYLKTKQECINETLKGNDNDNSTRENSTQN